MLNIKKLYLEINNKDFKKIIKSNFTLIFISSLVFTFAFYFYGIGRSRFYVRSDIIVRKGAKSTSDTGNSLFNLIGGGNLAATEDARFLKVYLQSPQILQKIEEKLNFKKAYLRNNIDPFAGLNSNVSDVDKFHFFKKQLSISLNEQAGIIIIRSFGYQPDTSFEINKFLTKEAELFVNNLNQDIYKKQLNFAKSQVDKNKEIVNKLSLKLSEFQNINKFLDAESEANSRIEYVLGLEKELIRQRLNLATLKRQFVEINDPEIVKVENLINDIKGQIKTERQLIVGESNNSLNPKLIEFNQLKNSLGFANEMYSNSLLTYEKTKSDSLQKQRFLAILQRTYLPRSTMAKMET